MIKSLRVLPIKSSILSLQLDIQRVYTAIKQNISDDKRAQLVNNLKISQQHRYISYDYFDQTTQLLSQPDNIKIVSVNDNTPIHANNSLPIFPLHYALTEDFRFRRTKTGPYFILQSTSILSLKFLAKFIDANIADLIPQIGVNFTENNKIQVDKILQLDKCLAAKILVKEVKNMYIQKDAAVTPEKQLEVEIESKFREKIGGDTFFEKFCGRGYEIFSQKCCKFQPHARSFNGLLCICPGCICVENRPMLNGKTILRDYRNGNVISGKVYYRQNKGFYQDQSPAKDGDLLVINAYQ
ncbi:hypothetical protein SS50377_25346 [Spironucleus salmonicida]|uniref:Uncharacterized protein n=1 Tax=Spironucleus salmonicida TaxID=348837 RepID=V6LBI8_9EUKA|nr:hypothetical protein SS50377_25346 [Spironucleus salmonicida]|eukprot:EST41777.1 Hypothetical protein SS50377_18610 [Spironucleus salmonicida]